MKTLPVALQLYSIRDILEEDPGQFAPVMRQLRAFGYDGVELAGTYGLAPAAIRDVLAEAGLAAVSAHVPLAELVDDAERVARDYRAIGCEYVVVPYLPETFRPPAPGYDMVLGEMARIGRVMRDHGLGLLYHNHDFEFVRMPGGGYGLDDLYARVPADLLEAEPDTCWIRVAGVDPAAYVRQYAGRCPVVHLKDFVISGSPKNLYQLIGTEGEAAGADAGIFEFRAVGFGQQVWRPILEAAVDAGARWVVVEQDEHYDIPALECARLSRGYLKLFGW